MNLKKILTTNLAGPNLKAVPSVACPHCAAELAYHPEFEGQTVECPKCFGNLIMAWPTKHEIAMARIKAKKADKSPLVFSLVGLAFLFIFWPLGILFITIGLVMSLKK